MATISSSKEAVDQVSLYMIEYKNCDKRSDDNLNEPEYFMDAVAAYKAMMSQGEANGVYAVLYTFSEDKATKKLKKSGPIKADWDKLVNTMFDKMDFADIKACTCADD